jgi:hypothetical protein
MRHQGLIAIQMIERRNDGSTSLIYEGRWAKLPRPGQPVSVAQREQWRVLEVRHIVDYSGQHEVAEVFVEAGAGI